jgi:peptidoglycan/xylan/chitin deacetylase (PgdA/CDA1 family)
MTPHLMTVDVDDQAGDSLTSASASERFVGDVITVLASTGTKATFFVPERTATHAPTMLREIRDAGHQIGCLTSQSLANRRPYDAQFRGALVRCRRAIEDATGRRVKGHRAARFGVTASSEWVYDVLIDEGFDYDSSRLPRHAEYGAPAVPASPHSVRRWCGTILEIPPTTTNLLTTQLQLVATPAIARVPLILPRQTIRHREKRGDPAMVHLRQSDVVRKANATTTAETRKRPPRLLRRIDQLLRGFEFTSVEEALPILSRTASVVEN